MTLNVVILAAGRGKRMKSVSPKILHKIGGMSLLERVVKTAHTLKAKVFVVYGHCNGHTQEALGDLGVTWVKQDKLLGTGHAVLQTLSHIGVTDQVLVLVGDIPLVSTALLKRLIETTGENGVGLITTKLEDPTGFGRVLHDQTGKILGIVEHKDTTPKQRAIKEVNSGIIMAPARKLNEWLPALEKNNSQNEYYLTDIIALAVSEGLNVQSVLARSSNEVLGINDRVQLAKLERIHQRQTAEEIMLSGVTLIDPNRFDLRGELTSQTDVIIDINVVLEGEVSIGKHSYIGPNCVLSNTVIGDNVTIRANSVVDGATIENGCIVGPFAHVRPGTHLLPDAKVGNFVEIKESIIGTKTKINHLSYIGDATIGTDVNIGAGTITCNYDGTNKYRTHIKDGAFIGSDTQLIAPVTIGEQAIIGAGSTITKDAPANHLTLSRTKQASKANRADKSPGAL